MTECQKCQDLLIEALYGELRPRDKAFFEAHLASCSRCAAEYREKSASLRVMDRRERPDPGQEFWDGYWNRLSARLEKEEVRRREPSGEWKKVFRPFGLVPRWAYQAAAALALVAIGIFAGRTLLSPPVPSAPQAQQQQAVTPPVQEAEAVLRARDYFDRSKLVLLALVNYDPKTQDPYGLDLPRQKQVSRELADEAVYLKNELKDPRQRRLRGLVTDLETILIQIANLESENDLEAVEFVKQGVENRGVLLKINLSEMGGGISSQDKGEPSSRVPSHTTST
jgi:hypothetical protein